MLATALTATGAEIVGKGANGMLTAEQLKPISDAITGNINVLLPVGIGIFGVMVGINLIPRIIYKFL